MIRTKPVYKVTVEFIIDVDDENFNESSLDSIIETYLNHKLSEDLGDEIEDKCYFDSYEVTSILPTICEY